MTPSVGGASGSSQPNATGNSTLSLSGSAPQSLQEANTRYAQIKSLLRSALSQKRLIDKSLADVESSIYLYEGSYLSSTAASGGNIVKGFDSYLKTIHPSATSSLSAISGGGRNNEAIAPEDRMFSNSSATTERSLELKANEHAVMETAPSGSHRKDSTSVSAASTTAKATPPPSVSAADGNSKSSKHVAEAASARAGSPTGSTTSSKAAHSKHNKTLSIATGSSSSSNNKLKRKSTGGDEAAGSPATASGAGSDSHPSGKTNGSGAGSGGGSGKAHKKKKSSHTAD